MWLCLDSIIWHCFPECPQHLYPKYHDKTESSKIAYIGKLSTGDRARLVQIEHSEALAVGLYARLVQVDSRLLTTPNNGEWEHLCAFVQHTYKVICGHTPVSLSTTMSMKSGSDSSSSPLMRVSTTPTHTPAQPDARGGYMSLFRNPISGVPVREWRSGSD